MKGKFNKQKIPVQLNELKIVNLWYGKGYRHPTSGKTKREFSTALS